jgi:hypothetical protein
VVYIVAEQREKWKWKKSPLLRVIYLEPSEYEAFPKAGDLDVLFDLIQAGLVEKAVE